MFFVNSFLFLLNILFIFFYFILPKNVVLYLRGGFLYLQDIFGILSPVVFAISEDVSLLLFVLLDV